MFGAFSKFAEQAQDAIKEMANDKSDDDKDNDNNNNKEKKNDFTSQVRRGGV